MWFFILKNALMVLLLSALICQLNLPFSEDSVSEFYTFMAACSAALFTVIGIWIAVVFPDYLNLIRDGQARDKVVDTIGKRMESTTDSIALLLRALLYSSIVIFVTMIIKIVFVLADISTISTFASIILSLSISLVVWQITAYYLVIKCSVVVMSGVDKEAVNTIIKDDV